ncbi:MAG: hypothetical protein WCG01_03440 [bacterium]
MNNKMDFQFNWPLLGNDQVIKFLSRSLVNGKISGMYIFVGPDDIGKTTTANYFTSALLCENLKTGGPLPCGYCAACLQNQVGQNSGFTDNFASVHPDYHLLKRASDKKTIEVDDVRAFIRSLEMSSFLNSYKVGVIKQAETLNDHGFNSLLKTLEEPRSKVIFILIAKNIESLPKTIISRAQVINFYPVKTDTIYDYLIEKYDLSRSKAKLFARLAAGRPALAVKFMEDQAFFDNYMARISGLLKMTEMNVNQRFCVVEELLNDKQTGQEASRLVMRIINSWQGVIRDLLLVSYGHPDLVQHELELESLNRIGVKITRERLLKFSDKALESLSYLKANVNPKLVLESLVLNF